MYQKMWRTIQYDLHQNKLKYIQVQSFDEALEMISISKMAIEVARPVYLGDDEAEYQAINEYYDEMIEQINQFVVIREEAYV